MSFTALSLALWAVACLGCDLARRRIPNLLTLGGIGSGALSCLALGTTPLGASASSAALAATGVTLVGLLLLAGGIVGAGDVKLLVAMGLLGGAPVLLATLLVGGLLAGAWALACSQAQRIDYVAALALGRSVGAAEWRRSVPLAVPFGLAFTSAVLGGAA